MFAIPGIITLLLFIYVRPQEFVDGLEGIPFLNLACVMALFGLVIDLKLRVLKPAASAALPWAVALLVWILATIIVKVPGADAPQHVIEVLIAFLLYFVIAHGVQSFQALQQVAGALVILCLFLGVICVHQGHADFKCVTAHWSSPGDYVLDGRPCKERIDCFGAGAEPGQEDYECERVGMFGTTTHDGRVRYRGVLQDPNELALAINCGLALLLGFAMRRRSSWRTWLGIVGVVVIAQAVLLTGSRGGQLELMAVLGIPLFRKYRWKALVLGVVMLAPLMVLKGGSSRDSASADESTEGRYEAWREGINMLKADPIMGVGHGMFAEHHVLTAHNSYVLSFAELGLPGFVLWTILLYMSIKVLVAGMRDFRDDPDAVAPRVWGVALLSAMIALMLGMLFLSLSYHFVLWLHFGLCGGYYSAVKHHRPEWSVRFGLNDVGRLAAIDIGFLMVLPVFLTSKGF